MEDSMTKVVVIFFIIIILIAIWYAIIDFFNWLGSHIGLTGIPLLGFVLIMISIYYSVSYYLNK